VLVGVFDVVISFDVVSTSVLVIGTDVVDICDVIVVVSTSVLVIGTDVVDISDVVVSTSVVSTSVVVVMSLAGS